MSMRDAITEWGLCLLIVAGGTTGIVLGIALLQGLSGTPERPSLASSDTTDPTRLPLNCVIGTRKGGLIPVEAMEPFTLNSDISVLLCATPQKSE